MRKYWNEQQEFNDLPTLIIENKQISQMIFLKNYKFTNVIVNVL